MGNSACFVFVAFASLVSFASAPAAFQPASVDWAQFRANPGLTGVAAADLPAALSLKWTYEATETIESSAAIVGGVVYIANGQDPEHGEGVGHMYAIDATKRGDITKTGLVWHYDKIRRSISTPSIIDGLLYIPDFSGFLHCLDVKTGQLYWTHDMFAAIWGSPMVADGKVYLGDEDGDVAVMAADKTMKMIAENNMGSSVYSTAVPANGAIFLVNRNQLFAIAEGK